MYRKAALLAAIVLLASGMTVGVFAQSQASPSEIQAAQNLHSLGLFMGDGLLADGSPNFALDRQPTRAEAITMFVRLIGGGEYAHFWEWHMPFTDVPSWARPYVGLAWYFGLTSGISETEFGSHQPVTAAQYITFILRALGYVSEVDFRWSSSWTLSDAKGITDGRFHPGTNHAFTRGDLALVSFNALNGTFAGTDITLAYLFVLEGVFTLAQAQAAGLAVGTGEVVIIPTPTPTPEPSAIADEFERRVFELTNIERRNHGLPDLVWDDRLAQAARAHSIDMAANNFLSHTGSDGSDVSLRLQRVGVLWSMWAENAASGHRTPEDVVEGWMNSPGHRQNILSGNTHLGVGFDNTGGRFKWTQKFAVIR